jgi:hypothetical protein
MYCLTENKKDIRPSVGQFADNPSQSLANLSKTDDWQGTA